MAITVERLLELGRALSGRTVGVAGDLIADVYQFGVPARLSREAPVLVVRHERERVLPGSAANSAMNVAALGARVHVLGALGRDEAGERVLARFMECGIETGAILRPPEWSTVTKTRILVGEPGRTPQQVVRIDREPARSLAPEEEDRLLERFEALDARVCAWLVSDYEYGLVNPRLARLFLRSASAGKPVVVDSRRNLSRFKGMDALCPNREEAEALVGHALLERSDLLAGGREILARLCPGMLAITLGNQGMALFPAAGPPTLLPVVGPDQVTDVSGAGDTVAATILLARAAGAAPLEAAWLATCAASVVVQKLGAATLCQAELEAAIRTGAPLFTREPVSG